MTDAITMTSNRPYLLRAVHEWIADNGLTPYIVVDATRPGVRVPLFAVHEGKVVLNVAPRAVAKLELGNDVITFMARFSGTSHAVQVPVAAVQAIYARENGQGMLLADDPPATLAESVTGGGDPATDAPAAATPPALQAVPTPPEPGASDADGKGPEHPRPSGKPTLRVVK